MCVVESLIKELERCFLAQEFMNATMIIYPKYWMALDVETTFPSLLALFKPHFCHLKIIVPFRVVVGPSLDSSLFDQQASFFMITMKTNNLGALHPP